MTAKDTRKGEKLAESTMTLEELAANSYDHPDAKAYAWAVWRRMENKRLTSGGEIHGYTGRNSNRR